MKKKSGLMDSMDDRTHRFFALAALFSGDFSIDWLKHMFGGKTSEIILLLEDGVRRGWLTKKGGGIYFFKNAKIKREYGKRLSAKEKEQGHKKIVVFFLKAWPDNNEKLLALSHHLQQVKCDGESARLLMDAGDVHLKAFRRKEALRCYSKIIDDLAGGGGDENDQLFIEAAIRYSRITTAPRHNHFKIISVLEEALIRASNLQKENYQALIYMHLAKNEWLCSQYEKAMKHFEKGWTLTIKLDQHELLRSAQTFIIYFSVWNGRYLEVVSNYEKFVPDVQIYPQGRFPLLATLLVGYCYALTGQTTQGLGMLDSIYALCQKRGDFFISPYAKLSIGLIMLDMMKVDEALQYLEPCVKDARSENNDWAWIWGELALAFGYYLKKNKKEARSHLQAFLKSRREVQIKIRHHSYLMELCLAIKNGELDPVAGLSIEREIKANIAGENIFLKGVAYRYKALLQSREGASVEKNIECLALSVKFLSESGHQLELAKSQLELARQYLLAGEKKKAYEMALTGSKILTPLNEELIPDDIRNITRKSAHHEDLLSEILKLSQEIATIRDHKELVQHIISAVNRITGAERGAIFLLEEQTNLREFRLRASKNLTSEQIDDPAFSPSLEIIREVAEKRKGIIYGEVSTDDQGNLHDGVIRSRICVPMILRDKLVGVLYHDNRLLRTAFKETDMEILAYFAAQAAIALDNASSYEEIQRLNQKLREENLYYEEQQGQTIHFKNIIGESSTIRDVLKKVDQVAATDTTVLIHGETGVGKEMVARAIHQHSPRRDKPFIRVFCNALPDTLIPSELFGHEKGAFTGATQRRIGRFELADGGTLFLDEIGDLPLDIQVRLLIVLQSKEFERVGGSGSIYSDFRLLVATNRDLEQEVNENRFRSDLFYRINVFPIHVPPLRERKKDIPLLAQHFLKYYAPKMGKDFTKILKVDMERLTQYAWPGNIRELENIVERGVILSNGPVFRVPELDIQAPAPAPEKSNTTLKETEYRHILFCLQKTGWKIRGTGGAAELLDIHPSTLDFRMKKLGIQKPRK
jgi:transcriptional regulator with GAF, ATPase, and Fis domain